MWFCWVHPVFSISISIHAEEMTKTWTAGGAFKPWPLNFAGEAQGLNDAIDVPEPQPRTHPLAEPEDAPSAKIKEATIGAMVDTFHFSGCSLINLWHERSPNGSRKVGPHHRWYIYIYNKLLLGGWRVTILRLTFLHWRSKSPGHSTLRSFKPSSAEGSPVPQERPGMVPATKTSKIFWVSGSGSIGEDTSTC